jgi:serine phosphatase RsbU (regulator of sigma subunit)
MPFRQARSCTVYPTRRTAISEFLFPRTPRRTVLGIALAVVLPIATVAVGRALDLPFPGSFVLLSVVIATAVGRMAAGLLASLVAGWLLSYYYIDPVGHLWPDRWEAVRGVAVFLLVSLVTAGLLSRARSAYEAAELARAEAAAARRAEEETRQRLDALSAASRALAVSFDVEENLVRAAELAIRYLGDSAAVYLPDGGGGLEPLGRAEREGIQPVEDPSPISVAGRSAVARAYRTGRPQARLPLAQEASEDDRHERELALPLTIGSHTLGVLSVARVSEPTPFTDDDIAFAEELARRMARAIENARLYHERDQIATVLQQSLLPGALPEIPGLSLAAHYEAAGEAYEVGGDFYDMIALGPAAWLFVVGDVCGKGPEAAAVMGFARASIRAAAQKDGDPEQILVTLNRALISQGWSRFVTVACIRIDRDGDQVRVRSSVGGHPRPVLITRDGELATLGTYGTVLGVFPDVELTHADARLGAGDSVVLYTDGLEGVDASAEDVVMSCFERSDGDGSARSIVRTLTQVRRTSRRAPADDLALLVVGVPR